MLFYHNNNNKNLQLNYIIICFYFYTLKKFCKIKYKIFK